MRECSYHVYILASASRVLYTGVTNNLERRLLEHKTGIGTGFTRRYRVTQLMYVESFRDVRTAIAREKEIKSWRRAKRVALIDAQNPHWRDLSLDWLHPGSSRARGRQLTEGRMRDSSLRSE